MALTRVMTAGPWRLDALEILHVTRVARFDRTHLLETSRSSVGTGEGDAIPRKARTTVTTPPALTRVKLRRLLAALNELHPETWREGPHTILERYLELTGRSLDLIAADTLDAQRTVANIASFLRFAADWQKAHPKGTLGEFANYLDAYQEAGGELPTSVELSEDVQGVRLMTLYQAKGLEYPHVFIPQLLQDEWPTREGWSGFFPRGAAAREHRGRGPPHGGGAAPAVRRHDARAGDAHAHHPRRADGREARLAVHRRDPGWGRLGEVEDIDRANRWTPVA